MHTQLHREGIIVNTQNSDEGTRYIIFVLENLCSSLGVYLCRYIHEQAPKECPSISPIMGQILGTVAYKGLQVMYT